MNIDRFKFDRCMHDMIPDYIDSSILSNFINDNQNDDVGRVYKNKMSKMNLKMTLKHIKSPFMFNKNLRKIAMKSSFMSIKEL